MYATPHQQQCMHMHTYTMHDKQLKLITTANTVLIVDYTSAKQHYTTLIEAENKEMQVAAVMRKQYKLHSGSVGSK